MVSLAELPKTLIRSQRPPTWAAGDKPYNEIRMEIHQCQRVAVGPYERGPIAVAFEVHDDFTAPPDCLEGDFFTAELLTGFWISDEAVANFLAENYGMPSGVLNLTSTGSPPDGWVLEIGGASSNLMAPGPSSNFQQSERNVFRFFWTDLRGGIGMMDWDSAINSDSLGTPAIVGQVNAPFLYATSQLPIYLGYGGKFSASVGHGVIKNWSVEAC